jgi:hypothetical protein
MQQLHQPPAPSQLVLEPASAHSCLHAPVARHASELPSSCPCASMVGSSGVLQGSRALAGYLAASLDVLGDPPEALTIAHALGLRGSQAG